MEHLRVILSSEYTIHLDVVEHKRSFAGHTIYRTTLKAYKDGILEPMVDVFVWRRYKEFKKLHKELKSVYSENKNADSFPEFIKAKIFGRFEEHIIEERRKSAACFLAFVASDPILYGCNAFRNFFEGSVKSNLNSNQNVSDFAPRFLEENDSDLNSINNSSNIESVSDTNEIEFEEIMSNSQPVTWNNRQPTPELQNDGNIAGNMQYIEPLSDFETFNDENQPTDSQIQTEIQNDFVDDDDAFSDGEDYKEEGSLWLRKAFSVCSEGEDIEKLASEADDVIVLDSTNSRHSSDISEQNDDISVNNNSILDNVTDCQNNIILSEGIKSNEEVSTENNIEVDSVGNDEILKENNNLKADEASSETKSLEGKTFLPQAIMMSNESNLKVVAIPNDSNDKIEVSGNIERDLNDQPLTKNVDSPEVRSGLSFSFDQNMTEKIQKMIENGDYIYHASLAMSEAIDLEEQHKYESSFELYKLGIGFLLEGVKQERNEEKRQAVRRKTAQYLLRAECLHNKHLSHSKKCHIQPNRVVSLSEVKSLGIIDNVVLVQLKDNEVYIMKVLHKCGCEYKNSKTSKRPKDRRYNESKFMVKVLYHAENSTGIYLCLEYIPTGLLWNYINPNWDCNIQSNELNRCDFPMNLNELNTERQSFQDEKPPEDLIRIWAAEIVIALENLHSSGIICSDLNPRNILLDQTGHIKLTYFSNFKDVDYHINEFAVIQSYAAPECRGVFEPTKAADWWSLGAILFELLTGKSLYSCYPNGIHSHSIINLPKPVSNEAWSLLAGLLRYNPRDRLGAGVAGCEEIKSHPFFTLVDWQELQK